MRLRKWIIDLMPQTDKYIEVFGGGGWLLLGRDPVAFECYNDIDQGLHNLFRVIADRRKFRTFRDTVATMPYSRDLYNDCLATWQTERSDAQRAAKWFVIARQSFGGRFGASWGRSTNSANRRLPQTVRSWLSAIDRLPEIHQRLQRVQIENRDWRHMLEYFDSSDALFYLDPPYVPETRKSGDYTHEMTADDHRELVDRILSLQGRCVLSGYDHPIYAPLGKQLEHHTKEVSCSLAGRTKASGLKGQGGGAKQRRTECLWIKR